MAIERESNFQAGGEPSTSPSNHAELPNKVPVDPLADPSPSNGLPSPTAELERLQHEIKKLEGQHQRDLQLLEALLLERLSYRRAINAWAKSQVTPEDLLRWDAQMEEGGGQELKEFFGELESIVRENTNVR